jgi:hypothetical protein
VKTDKEILDWMESHSVTIDADNKYSLFSVPSQHIKGNSLRELLSKAIEMDESRWLEEQWRIDDERFSDMIKRQSPELYARIRERYKLCLDELKQACLDDLKVDAQ